MRFAFVMVFCNRIDVTDNYIYFFFQIEQYKYAQNCKLCVLQVIKQYKAGILHSLVGLAACSKNVFQILHLVRYLIKNYLFIMFC